MPGTWRALTHQPSSHVERMLLLTDGTVFCHLGNEQWYLLHPDPGGHYHNGNWSFADNMHHARRNFGACVLADGRVLVALGWPNLSSSSRSLDGDNSIEIFNPTARSGSQWTLYPANPGWGPDGTAQTHICPLADGRHVLVGTDNVYALPFSDFAMGRQSSIYDTLSNTWRLVSPGNERGSDLQAWTLLRDGSVLSTNGFPNDFRYLPDAGIGRWMEIGHGRYSGDVYIPWEGQGLLLPDGRVWIVSKVDAETVFYHPGAAGERGTWTPGPVFPDIVADHWRPETSRFSACILPGGKVLCSVNSFNNSLPVFYEFDPFNGDSIVRVDSPVLRATSNLADPGPVLLLLPTGEVLMSCFGQMAIYTAEADARAPQASWRPYLSSPTTSIVRGSEYRATGTLFNGMSQAVCHNPWKSAGTGTNYPIVRLRNVETGLVQYVRSYRHSSMGVATGTAPQATSFRVPEAFPQGEADLCIIANGIESNCIRVTVMETIRMIREPKEWNQLIGNLADGALFILRKDGLHPVPPFGPDVYRKKFISRTVKAYEHVLRGLLLMNAGSEINLDNPQNLASGTNDQSLALTEMNYGLALLRKLGDELDVHLNKSNGLGKKLEADQMQG